ncbi:2-iminobutanoate/2-iminopropanoate deaminase-like [Ixodes scapularis]|uniref:2-iminobutanoate/2-iminopropanoate deaminase-like n=1 Tax=Ixodes scapularis TaxID=6945 RepID=UPI001A9E6CAA|nr:2-iminobutanoate/2-iminopropanoate deaminase-like [Ixodes scapularis]
MLRATCLATLFAYGVFGTAPRQARELINAFDASKGPPYTPAIRVGNVMHVAGKVGQVPMKALIVPGGIVNETRQALTALEKTLKAGRMSLKNVAKTTVYLTNWNNYDEMNKIYLEYFPEKFPARSALQVVKLPSNAHVQIEAVAVHSDL